jgi:hypothetical protein
MLALEDDLDRAEVWLDQQTVALSTPLRAPAADISLRAYQEM